MSYEGYYEWLCENGHYSASNCYAPEPKKCRVCGARIAHRCGVDQTNGVDPECPYTMPGKKRKVGTDDEWTTDHHGNKFAIAHPRYKPTDDRWRKIL